LKKPGLQLGVQGSEPGQGRSPGNAVPPTVTGAPLRLWHTLAYRKCGIDSNATQLATFRVNSAAR